MLGVYTLAILCNIITMADRREWLTVSGSDRVELERRVRSRAVAAREAQRARIVLLASQGYSGLEICELVGVSEPSVEKWRCQYDQSGFGQVGRAAAPRPSKGGRDDDKVREVLWHTLLKPPEDLGGPVVVAAARQAGGAAPSQVARIWQRRRLK